MKLSVQLYEQARDLIADRLGLDFPERRRADLERGLARVLRSRPATTPHEVLAWLGALPADSHEWRRVAADLTVGETYFFRDGGCFEALEQKVLSALVQSRRAEGAHRLRLWSAACATGEEPYSIAMVLDRLLPDRADWTVTILATDISGKALEAAQRGRYREWALRETPAAIRHRYFRRLPDESFELDPHIRAGVTFAPLNLAGDAYPSLVTNTVAMDLILCRNVLMYFTPEAQRAAVARLQRALVPGGWLVVSPAEASSELFSPLTAVNFPGAIFYRKTPAARPDVILPDLAAPLSPHVAAEPVRQPPIAAAPPERAAPAPADAATSLQHARALADQGDLERARELCETTLARDRLNADAHLLLAAIHQERGQLVAALAALRHAIYLAPDSAPAHFLMGCLLVRQGERRRGRRCMETVVGLLTPLPRDEVLAAGDGLTAGRLMETAQAYLESR